MILNIKPPRKVQNQPDSERIRELENWAEQLTKQLNVILSSIGEENLSKKLKEKINTQEV